MVHAVEILSDYTCRSYINFKIYFSSFLIMCVHGLGTGSMCTRMQVSSEAVGIRFPWSWNYRGL